MATEDKAFDDDVACLESGENYYKAFDDVIACLDKGENYGNQDAPSIFRVPRVFRALSSELYDPQVVSIGPLLRGHENVKEFEDQKKSYLCDLLRRVNRSPKTTLEACLKKVNTSMDGIKKCYEGIRYSDVELANMMVLDCCFIIEFLHKFVDNNNPIWVNQLLVRCIARDLVRVENQVPFVVLKDIFDCTVLNAKTEEAEASTTSKPEAEASTTSKPKAEASLVNSLVKLLDNLCPFKKELMTEEAEASTTSKPEAEASTTSKPEAEAFLVDSLVELLDYLSPIKKLKSPKVTTYDHILGLMHKIYVPAPGDAKSSSRKQPPTAHSGTEQSRAEDRNSDFPRPHSAMQLDRAGVNFKPRKDGNGSIAMEYKSSRCEGFPWYWGKPTFGMPVLLIQEDTELVLRNLIAYEQFSGHFHSQVTWYAKIMDMLVDSGEDISKLVESKVIISASGSNEEAAKMINRLCKEVALDETSSNYKQWQQLDKYYYRIWPRNIAGLRRTYFSSPWNFIALVAGVILFALTVVQTVFAIRAD